MLGVRIREGESIDSAIRRFKRTVEKAGIPKELRRREFYQKGSMVRKRKAAAARKRHLKKLMRETFGSQAGQRDSGISWLGRACGFRGRRTIQNRNGPDPPGQRLADDFEIPHELANPGHSVF